MANVQYDFQHHLPTVDHRFVQQYILLPIQRMQSEIVGTAGVDESCEWKRSLMPRTICSSSCISTTITVFRSSRRQSISQVILNVLDGVPPNANELSQEFGCQVTSNE